MTEPVSKPIRQLLSLFESLGNENRLRILTLLDRNEFSVSELVSALQLPQSTVSRHLRVLADHGWVRRRQEGRTRYYRMETELQDGAQELWRVSVGSLLSADWIGNDAERADSVLAKRREQAVAFFSKSAPRWDSLRDELFGRDARFAALLGLLDPEWVVGDLGAGTGVLTEMFAPFVRRVIAVDRSPEMLAAATARLEVHENIEVRVGALQTLPMRDGELDLAVLMLVLHFTSDPRRVLSEAARALAPGGKLIVVDMRAHGRDEYREMMGHVWPGFTADQLRNWIRHAGLETFRGIPLRPDPAASGPSLFAATARKPDRVRRRVDPGYI